ncbi:MAG: hypothetical protein WCG78_01320 [Candidatus Omnitrophota bacterium]
MKAFFVGLLFLGAAASLMLIGVLLFPLLIILGVLLRAVISLLFVVFAIWLLGKLILWVWTRIKR